MRKRALSALLAVLLVLARLSLGAAWAEMPDDCPQSTFTLPAALQEIAEEAFAGTAVRTVVLPEGLLFIGSGAFVGAVYLMDVFIPPATEFIADDAFSADANLTVHGVAGSYAQEWAEKHRLPFVVEDIWKFPFHNGRTVGVQETGSTAPHQAVNPERIIQKAPRAAGEEQSMRPQDRPELNPIDYRFP